MSDLEPIGRICRSCRQRFVISVHEQKLMRRLQQQQGASWALPARCTPCRVERRRQSYTPIPDDLSPDAWVQLTCVSCEATFKVGPQDIAYLRARGFGFPRRCRSCRERFYAERVALREGLNPRL